MPHLRSKVISPFLGFVLGAFLAPCVAAEAPPSTEAAALFERLKGLEGTWVGRSTKGVGGSDVVPDDRGRVRRRRDVVRRPSGGDDAHDVPTSTGRGSC